jgi:uncharacterized protein YbjT (DUF2867 family)
MKVIVFGATGMVGQGVLRECLLDPEVESVLVVGRSPTGRPHEKLRELTQKDLFDLSAVAGELSGFDACFFCLGVSSVGMKEADYRKVTCDLTLSIARTLLKQSPGLTFVYVSGASTDSSAKGSSMWARVKGDTENQLLQLGFKRAFMFRPGFIQPMHGEASRVPLYRFLYVVLTPLVLVFKTLFPKLSTTTERMGRAMLEVARNGDSKSVLEIPDINAAAERFEKRS